MCSWFSVVMAAVFSFAAAGDIVGVDDRIELRHSAERVRELGRSIAVHTNKHKLLELADRKSSMILHTSAAAENNFCEDMRFASQGVAGECTATLIAADEVMLAAHCLTEEPSTGPFDLRTRCETSVFLFDFRQGDDGTENFTVSNDQVYRCKSVRRFWTAPAKGKTVLKDDGKRLDDYAFVKLDRPVPKARPLRFPKDEAEEKKLLEAKDGERVVLHHPHGTVMKASPVGKVEFTESNLLRLDVDVSKGSSGSPMVDVASRTILAVMKGVTYPDDYLKTTQDAKLRCRREYVFGGEERPVIGVRAHLGWQLHEGKVEPRLTQ